MLSTSLRGASFRARKDSAEKVSCRARETALQGIKEDVAQTDSLKTRRAGSRQRPVFARGARAIRTRGADATPLAWCYFVSTTQMLR